MTNDRLVFAFSGLGPQRWGAGRELLAEEPVFREALTDCDALVRRHADFSPLAVLQDERYRAVMDDCGLCYPVTLAVQIALTELWRSWGIMADAVFGASAGESAAAYAAGILSREDALRVAVHTGRLVQACSRSMRMATIGMPADELEQILRGYGRQVTVAAFMTPSFTVVSGTTDAVGALLGSLRNTGVSVHLVPFCWAAHTHHLAHVREQLLAALEGITPRAAALPMMSTVTGHMQAGADCGPEYWWGNLSRPVLFMQTVGALILDGHQRFLEIGPEPALSRSIEELLCVHECDGIVLPSLRRRTERLTMRASFSVLYPG